MKILIAGDEALDFALLEDDHLAQVLAVLGKRSEAFLDGVAEVVEGLYDY